MVVTRSAEKRLAAAGRIEELAVRPKISDYPATPTPSIPKSRTTNNASIDPTAASPQASGTRNRKSNLEEAANETGGDDDDDLSFLTAKESPDEYRDAHSLLGDTSLITTPSTRLTKAHTGSSNPLITTRSSPIISSDSKSGSRNNRAAPQNNLLEPGKSEIHKQPDSGQTTETNVETFSSAQGDAGEDERASDDAPETFSSKKVTKRRRSTASRLEKQSTLVPTPPNTVKIRNHPVAEHILPRDTEQAAKSSSVHPAATMDTVTASDSPSIVSSQTGRDRSVSNIIQHAHGGRARSIPPDPRDRVPARPRSIVSMDSHKPRQQISNGNPPRATNSLELFRHNVLIGRAASSGKKRSRNFSLASDWSTKRQKFIPT